MADLDHELVNIFSGTGVTRAIANPARIDRDKKIDSAFDNRGNLRAGSLDIRLTERFWISGTIAVGTNVAQEFDVEQAGTLRKLTARVKSAPIGSEATFVLAIDGVAGPAVTITAGTLSGTSNISVAVTAGQVLTLNATAVGSTTPAETATVSVTYSPSS